MAKIMRVKLPDGKTLLFGAPEAGLREVSLASKLVDATAGQFDAALGALGGLVSLLEAKVAKLPTRPAKVEIEFGASLSGEADLCIVSGHGEAEFKVTLTWGEKAEG